MSKPQEEDIVFGATLSHVKLLRQILKALTTADDTKDVIFGVEKDGVRMTVEDGLCLQASFYIPREWFTQFFLKPSAESTPISFALNLNTLSGCLRMTPDDECTVVMIYCGDAFPVTLAFNGHDGNISIEAELKTKIFGETLNFHKHSIPMDYNRVLMGGSNFSLLFSEIDVASEEVEILLSPKEPFFLLRATGKVEAEATVQLAKTSNHIISFNCTRDVQAKYRTSHIRFASKCLAFAHTGALTLYTTGLLSIEILIGRNVPENTMRSMRRNNQTTVNNPDDSYGVLKYFITSLTEDTDR
ncbi:cell cycle checkpoint protein RAD1 [Phlebotomus argentipes]|uniref:cell cycle checkpoint protein RAD1 n=1 Tax=Phlebotomus argentipes TaxID=94469 RepID=UPI002892CE79|nr:cell cycle checkpoint protein RAD1 [Phlebotomus argentipes]